MNLLTVDMRDRGISSFRIDSMPFYTNKYKDEMPSDEQKAIMDSFVETKHFPKAYRNKLL